MILSNLKIVLPNHVFEHGSIEIKDDKIVKVYDCIVDGYDVVDCKGLIAMPGFIDVHFHGSCGIDFMDASVEDYKEISKSLYKEGITTYLATTLTSDFDSMMKVCRTVKEAKKENPSLYGIHFEGPYISAKHKGAQNEDFIRNPSIDELKKFVKESGFAVKYITLAPEKEGAMDFIKYASSHDVVCSAGHTDASFDDVELAIKNGLTNTTHTHNAMSGHHHRNPGVVTASFYFDELFTECICDKIHVCPNSLKTFYKIVGPDRFMIITDALKAKHSDLEHFDLFGLPCEKKNGAAYLLSGPLAGSLLTMDQGVRNMKEITNASLSELSRISSLNQARCLHLNDRGSLEEGKLADIVLLDENLFVKHVYKNGKEIF